MRNKECLFEYEAPGNGGGCASLRANATDGTAGSLKGKGVNVRTRAVSQGPNSPAGSVNLPAFGSSATAFAPHATASGSDATAFVPHAAVGLYQKRTQIYKNNTKRRSK